jgi:Bacterial Ig-like domain (group 3)
MRLNRPLVVVKAASVTALAAAACATFALPAGAATAAPRVVKFATTTVVSAPKTGFTHTNIKLSATEKGKGGNPTGTVTFWSGTRKLCHGSLKARKTSCVAQFVDPAVKTVIAKYSGNAHHKASSGTAKITITNKPSTGGGGPIGTTTTVTSPAPTPPNTYSYVNAGDAFTLKATVAPASGAAPTGTVAFTVYRDPDAVPANLECTATLTAADNGQAQCNVQTEVGTWGFLLYEATFTPTPGSNWTGSDSGQAVDHKLVTWDITSTMETFNQTTATVGTPVTVTADVTDEPLVNLSATDSVAPDVVTFSIGGVNIPGCTAVPVTDPSDGPDNIATCSYTPTAADGTAGSVTIKAAYSGDDYALPSSDTETLPVTP